MPIKVKKEKREEGYFGGGRLERIMPEDIAIRSNTKIVNISLKYEEVLKLNMAILDCLLSLNRTNFATAEGKRVRAYLAIDFSGKRINVWTGYAPKKVRNQQNRNQ
ncbi:MAG: hypothetical protein PVH29_06585 [Candidatus Zixiibacteriota bacterium]|jgi:hypothetical protein